MMSRVVRTNDAEGSWDSKNLASADFPIDVMAFYIIGK
jgi:hypothetical protein